MRQTHPQITLWDCTHSPLSIEWLTALQTSKVWVLLAESYDAFRRYIIVACNNLGFTYVDCCEELQVVDDHGQVLVVEMILSYVFGWVLRLTDYNLGYL